MNRKDVILKNSIMGFLSQGLTLVFTFLTRNLFIHYIGVEMLGINSTFTSVLSTLSLAELGVHSAIVYNLYRPLHEKNIDEINDVMNIFKIIYRYIGVFFILASIIVLPFLKYIITDIEVDSDIYLFFLLQAFASTCTYFLAYKRAILYADQKEYIAKFIDMFINIVFNVLQCITLVIIHSYVFYLILRILQVYINNLLVHFYCSKNYSYLHRNKINKQKLKTILGNMKNIFAGKVASYIYNSTDSLVISTFVSTVSVGYLVNYTTVTNSIKTLSNSVLNPIIPIIGNYLVDEKSDENKEKTFLLYTYVRYLIALIIVVPFIVLIDDFITIWLGADMILVRGISYLIAIDLYIHLVHSATADFINGDGLFKENRNVEIVGAISNVVLSLVFVHSLGISGVLLGTVLSQMIFWIGRSLVVYKYCFTNVKQHFYMYWRKNLIYLLLIGVCIFICKKMYVLLMIENIVGRFILGGFICEIVVFVVICFVFLKTSENRQLFTIIKKWSEKINFRDRS